MIEFSRPSSRLEPELSRFRPQLRQTAAAMYKASVRTPALKTNRTTHLLDNAWVSESPRQQMGWSNLLNPGNLILKILKQFIRCELNPALGGENGLAMKTNCTTYLIDNAQLMWKSAKRTEQVKHLNQKGFILKILNPFIRYHPLPSTNWWAGQKKGSDLGWSGDGAAVWWPPKQ